MADLRELYQELILEHSKAPRNYRELKHATSRAEGYNPLCGDRFTVSVQTEGDSIRDIAFQGSGCAISKASASMMTESVKGKTKEQAKELFEHFHRTVTGSQNGSSADLGEAVVFAESQSSRPTVKCARPSLGILYRQPFMENRRPSTE